MTLYDEVEAMTPGTVWHCGGAPWFRSTKGVIDLMSHTIHDDGEIPEGWRKLNPPVTIIYNPHEED